MEEVQVQDLLGVVQPTNDPPQEVLNNVQLGMIQTVFPEVDPVFNGLSPFGGTFSDGGLRDLMAHLPEGMFSASFGPELGLSPVAVGDAFGLSCLGDQLSGPSLFHAADGGNFLAHSGPSPAALRLWAKYLSSVDPSLPSVSIPKEWMDFFTMLLLQQTTSEWAT